MKRLYGDYYSNIQDPTGWWLVLILTIIMIAVIIIGLRRQKIREDRARRRESYQPSHRHYNPKGAIHAITDKTVKHNR
jgi:hypothetical protein